MGVAGRLLLAFTALPAIFAQQTSTNWPNPTHGDFAITNFTFDSGEALGTLKIHYQTLGQLEVYPNGTNNAILILHGSTGSGEQFLNNDFAGVLFNPGQILDARKYFIIIPDGIGHGNSSKPSNTGLKAKFPSYQYADMIRANYRLLTEHLGVDHTRLILGVSMGGMHTWMMGEKYPDYMDVLMPIATTPAQIAGQNRLWRKFIIELIKADPAWKGGNYAEQPLAGLSGALALSQIMFSAPVSFLAQYPTRDAVDRYVDELLPHVPGFDANDQLYAWNASHFYDPRPGLRLIKAPLTAVNTADDLMNPAALGILEDAVKNEMRRGVGKAVVIPVSNATVGHGSYIRAKLWKDELALLLSKTQGGKYNCA
ncbi:alpha/beta-hydrolase [Byssothecium circinans]|uniref:Alpha/beta-hydrolase n=1 Tax=Byssothecium circinans TaxID=147558 RepID=A0A6A5TLQ6_9PLEO|nr:alpha/beta-hydrolase [Byssothecium circinans]